MKFNVILLCSSLSQNKALIDQEYKDFLNELIRSGNELSDSGDPLFYIGSGGTEEQFKKIYQKFNEPYVLIATDHNNSLPAGLEILTFLNNLGLSGVIKHGNIKNIILQINESLNTTNDFHCHKPFIIDNLLLNKRYGVIGKPSDWLIASDVDYQVAKKKLGCDLIDISIEEVFERAKRYHIFLDKNSKVSLNSITILKALQEILYEYKLDGFTIRCFDLLNSIHTTACYALAYLNSQGFIATCEGDIPSMLSMAVVKELTGKSSFQANPSFIDVDNNEIVLAHCTLPLDMTKSYKITTHYESGIGDAIKGELFLKKVHIFKLSPSLDDYFYLDGEIVENLHSTCLCRTQIRVKTTQEIRSLLTKPFANHLIIYYSDDKQLN